MIVGKRSLFARIDKDNYETPVAAVLPLLRQLPAASRFVEPCCSCGKSRLADVLVGAGHVLVGAYGLPEGDARVAQYKMPINTIFATNPPYHGQAKDLHRLIANLSDQAETWLLLPLDWCANLGSGEIIRTRCSLIAVIGRIRWFPDTPCSSKDNYAWVKFSRVEATAITRFVGRVAA